MGIVGLLVAADRGSRTIPKPNEPIPKQEIIKLTGQFKNTKLSRDIRILWLYGPEDHGGGEHDYIRIKRIICSNAQDSPKSDCGRGIPVSDSRAVRSG